MTTESMYKLAEKIVNTVEPDGRHEELYEKAKAANFQFPAQISKGNPFRRPVDPIHQPQEAGGQEQGRIRVVPGTHQQTLQEN